MLWNHFIKLRKKQPALSARPETESFLIATSSDQQVLAYITRKDANQVLVILNLSAMNIDGIISDINVSGKFKELASGKQVDFSKDRSIQLTPWEYRIFVK